MFFCFVLCNFVVGSDFRLTNLEITRTTEARQKNQMKVVVLYVGSSLLAPLKQAEREINRQYNLDLEISAHNFGLPMDDDEWRGIVQELQVADIVFAIHVMDGENATRLIAALNLHRKHHSAVIVINCMPELMRQTRMGRLDGLRLAGVARTKGEEENGEDGKTRAVDALGMLAAAGSWVGRQVKRNNGGSKRQHGHSQYLKWIDRLPGILRFVPSAGGLRDVKNYLGIFCYFLQPTPANIRFMVLTALKEYVPDNRLLQVKLEVPPPERMPSVAIYHPDATELFETFEDYRNWYKSRPTSNVQRPMSGDRKATSETLGLQPDETIGLLLMRPQVVSKTTKHYDALIRAIEAEGLSVIPALSTLMDNREAVSTFFLEEKSKVQSPTSNVRTKSEEQRAKGEERSPKFKEQRSKTERHDDEKPATDHSRVSQIVSLTGFSFVGGPAMNDSEAAAAFLNKLNRPYRSAVSLDTQTIDSWRASQTGLNPVQAGMQIAIPEIDGATEPFIYGGLPASGVEPIALADRCTRYARRLKRWNRLRTAPPSELKLALVLFCFPPNKGNIGTAADLDVFPSLWDTLKRLRTEGYQVELPESAEALREQIIGGSAESFGAVANVAYRMPVAEYRRLCPYVDEVEQEWGSAPGAVNSFGDDLLIQGVQLGNVFVGVQPTFGYEGDPMRLMMARSGAPHHGFNAFYAYLSHVLNVDAVVHVGLTAPRSLCPANRLAFQTSAGPID